MNKIRFIAIFFLFFSSYNVFAEMTARTIANESAQKDTLAESLAYLQKELSLLPDGAEKRSLYYFTGTLQEQAALYDDARASYVAAAAIAAGDADGMAKRTSEELVIDAVRSALSCGDWKTADLYLNSSVRNSTSDVIQSYIKLYSVWSLLCQANTRELLEEPIALLKAYVSLSSLENVRKQILFTLWYLTGEKNWADNLKNDYPHALETGIVNGSVKLLPAPFWFFVPHNDIAFSDSDESDIEKKSENISTSIENKISQKSNSSVVKMQLGLFRDKANADALVKRLSEKKFSAYIITETRSSGTTYFIVLVDDTDGNIANKLRSEGFECYRYE